MGIEFWNKEKRREGNKKRSKERKKERSRKENRSVKIFWVVFLFLLLVQLVASPLVCPLWSNESRLYLQRGDSFFLEGNYTEALEEYRKALSENPYYRGAKMGMGKSFLELGDSKKALSYFQSVEKEFPNDPELQLWLARTQLKENRLDSAEVYLLKASRLRPRDYNLHILYGDLFVARGLPRQAMPFYREAIRIHPGRQTAYLKLADRYLALQEPKSALVILEKLQDIEPRSPALYIAFGRYFYQSSDWESSRRYLVRARSLEPKNTETLDLLYRVFYELGEWEKALDTLQSILVLDRPQYYFHSAQLLDRLNRPLEALKILREADRLYSGDEALMLLADQIYHRHDRQNPEIQKEGEYLAETWFQKGIKYQRQNLTEHAHFSFLRAMELNLQDPKVHKALANLYRSQKLFHSYYRELKRVESLLNQQKDRQIEDATEDDRNSGNGDDTSNKVRDNSNNIEKELRFAERILQYTLSWRKSVDLSKDGTSFRRPKILLMPLEKNKDFEHHYGVEKLFREIFYTALKMRNGLQVSLMEELAEELATEQNNQNNKNDLSPRENLISERQEELARNQGVDFLIRGKVEEQDGIFSVDLRLINLLDGEVYRRIQVEQKGASRFLSTALYASKRVQSAFPVLGQIFFKNHKEIWVDLGYQNGYRVGDRLYVLTSRGLLHEILRDPELENLMRQRVLLEEKILRHSKNRNIEELEILEIDEEMSQVRLLTSDFLDEVEVGDYVLKKP